MQQRDKAKNLVDEIIDELPQLDCTSPTAEFPQPPPSIIVNYPISKDDLSSSEVPSLFAEDITDTNVIMNDEITTEQENVVEVEEEIIPKFCSLLYDGDNNECDKSDQVKESNEDCDYIGDCTKEDIGTEEKIVPVYCSLLYDKDYKIENVFKNSVEVDIEIIPKHSSLYDEENNVEVEEEIIPKFSSLLYDGEGTGCESISQVEERLESNDQLEELHERNDLVEECHQSNDHVKDTNEGNDHIINCIDGDVEIEENIVPVYCSLLYDKDKKEIKMDKNIETDKDDTNITNKDVVEEKIVAKHCSLLYDEENNECNVSDMEIDEEKVTKNCSFLYDGDNQQCDSGNINEEADINLEKVAEKPLEVLYDEENNECKTSMSHDDMDVEDSTIPRYYSIPYDEENDGNDEVIITNMEASDVALIHDDLIKKDDEIVGDVECEGDGVKQCQLIEGSVRESEIRRVSYEDIFPANDPLPCSFDLSQLNCQSPEETMDDGEC